MGITMWPCPKCGQMQRIEHPNGMPVKIERCAVCTEAKKATTTNNDAADDGA